MTTGTVLVWTQPAASLHQRSMVKGMAETITSCATSSTTEMHAAELKTSAEIRSVMSRSSTMKETMTITTPTMTNLTGNILEGEKILVRPS
jgi:hypothetical protein